MADTPYALKAGETLDEYYKRVPGSKPGASTTGVTRPGIDTPPAPGTPPAAATPPSSYGMDTTGISASFAETEKQIEDATKGLSSLFPTYAPGSPEELASPEYKAKEARKAAIETKTEIAKSDIADVQREGTFQKQRAGELLGMSPAAIKNNIEQFIIQSDKFDNGIARSIERLNEEESSALAAEDYNYATQVRQNKIDFFNLQHQAASDKLSFMTNAFNMMLTGANIKRQNQSDAMTYIQNAFAMGMQGKDIPPDVWATAGYTGDPSEVVGGKTWGTPYMENGALVQKNQITGEIKTLIRPKSSAATDTVTPETIDAWATDVLNGKNGLTIKSVPIGIRNDVELAIASKQKAKLLEKTSKATPSGEMSWWDSIVRGFQTAPTPGTKSFLDIFGTSNSAPINSNTDPVDSALQQANDIINQYGSGQ